MEHLKYVTLFCKQLCVLKNVSLRAVYITNCTVLTEIVWYAEIDCTLHHIRRLFNLAQLVGIRNCIVENPLAYIVYHLNRARLPGNGEPEHLDNREPTDIYKTKTKNLFEDSVQVVLYPDGWRNIRDVFKLLDHRYYLDGQLDYRAWDNVDLKDLDHGNVSKLVVHVLECINYTCV